MRACQWSGVRDDDGVDRLVVEDAAEVGDRRGLRRGLDGLRQVRLVDVADGGDLHVGEPLVPAHDAEPLAAGADDADADAVVGAEDAARGGGRVKGGAGADDAGGAGDEEGATVEAGHGSWLYTGFASFVSSRDKRTGLVGLPRASPTSCGCGEENKRRNF